MMLSDFTDKMDALDLIIAALKDHEKRLSHIVDKLEEKLQLTIIPDCDLFDTPECKWDKCEDCPIMQEKMKK